MIIVAAISTSQQRHLPPNISASPTPVPTVRLDGTVVRVELADTSEKRFKGLSGVREMPEDQGMLFVFESQDVEAQFVMRDMYIPLDIIWIDNNEVVKIDANLEPRPGVVDDSQLMFYVGNSIDYVLEVNGGFAEKNGIKVGSKVTLPF